MQGAKLDHNQEDEVDYQEGEGEENERQRESEAYGWFEDFEMAEKSVALGRVAAQKETSAHAFDTAAEIANYNATAYDFFICLLPLPYSFYHSLLENLPEMQQEEITFLRQLWKQKMELLNSEQPNRVHV